MRKILAVLISVIMICGCIPQTIFASGGFDANAEYGRDAACAGCTLSSVNGVDACTQDGKLHICSINFEDPAFRDFLTDKYGSDFVSIDTILTTDEIQPVGAGIESLEGIEFFRDLDWLGCFSNDLTELDIRNNPNITTLYCAENKLTTLDLRYNTKLDFVNCISNQLSELLLSDDCKITVLSIAKNRFASFDVSKMMNLESLYAAGQTIVLEETDRIDMSEYVDMNDWDRISEVQGGYFDADTGMIYVDEGSESVSYVYDTGLYDLPNYVPDSVPDDEKLIVTFKIGEDPVPPSWQKINGVWFLFNDAGEMLTGWQKVNGTLYYLYPGSTTMGTFHGQMVTGLREIDGEMYYFASDGAMQTGWQKIDGGWYLFNDTGEMLTGWQKINGVWYYLYPDINTLDANHGQMVTGWRQIGGARYYFATDGAMQTGWQKIDRGWYYFAADGAMQTGWRQIDGVWYYLYPRSTTMGTFHGQMVTGWREIDGEMYYFASDGAMQTGWQKIDGGWYLFNDTGEMLTGWQKINGVWYYLYPDINTLDANHGQMVTGWRQVNGKWYYFKSSGTMAAGEWCEGYWLNADGSWTYQPKGSWKQDSKGWWFGDTSGWYAKNSTVKIDNVNYTFNAAGYWVK